jgi:hypothetical protein
MRTETDVQNLTRLAVQAAGGVAWRNNRGALPNPETGVPIRFGLANDSSQLDRTFKTGDLVGLYPAQMMVDVPVWNGTQLQRTVIGIFCMWECKPPGWRWRGTDREVAQWNAIKYVRERGGRAGFVTHPDEAVAVMLGTSRGAYDG